jgi:tetratricopeptide (TPR) repeat protein
VKDGSPLWAYKCDEYCTDVFAAQDTISENIVTALSLRLSAVERERLTQRYTSDPEAFQSYLLGRYFWNKRTEEGMKKGLRYFEQAKQKDPNFALAHAGLADSYNVLGFYAYLAPNDSFPRAKAAATEALKIDDRLAEAHNSLAYASLYYDWDWQAAEAGFKRAIELNPNYSVAHQWYGNYLTAMGRWEEALAEFSRARQLDPLSLVINAVPAWTCFYAHQYDRAIEQARKALELDRTFALGHIWLAQAYERKGMREEAIGELREALDLAPGAPDVMAMIAHVHAMSGRRDEALKALGELRGLSKRRYVSSYHIALVYAGLGEKDEAFKWLNKSVDDRQNILVFIEHDPRLDELHSDPRFQGLLRRVGIAW